MGGADGRETEKPKVSGWSAKRRLRMVDLPEPEGPEMTMGRCFGLAGCGLSVPGSFREAGRMAGEVEVLVGAIAMRLVSVLALVNFK